MRHSLVGLIPVRRGISLVLAQRRDSQVDGLVLIRTVFLSFVSALVTTALVVTVVLGHPGDPETAEGLGLASIVVVVVGLVSLFDFRRIGGRSLECSEGGLGRELPMVSS